MPRQRTSERNEIAADGRRLYSLGDVCALTYATRAQGENWVRKRVIVPDYPAQGTGNYRGFTFRNVVEFQIAFYLAHHHQPLFNIREALQTLRDVDPDEDWYSVMPRAREALDQLPSDQPTEAEAREWLYKNDAKFGVGGGDFTDPQWLAEAERFYAVLTPPPMTAEEEAEDQERTALWRRFKDPSTRSNDPQAIVTLCDAPIFRVTFSATELQQRIQRMPFAVVVNLSRLFAELEAKTGDHWEKRDPTSDPNTPK